MPAAVDLPRARHLPARSPLVRHGNRLAAWPLGRILADEPVPLARAVDLFGQVLAAIAAAHRSGVLHGDVKTDNFLVEAIDGADHVTLIDFGLAQVICAPPRADLEHGEISISGTRITWRPR
jgi:serine/threonine protein kinase